jgi:Family of unknown function (DUF6496)
MKSRARTKAGKQMFVGKVMGRFKRGNLRSGGGGKIKSRSQAIAAALNMAGLGRRKR